MCRATIVLAAAASLAGCGPAADQASTRNAAANAAAAGAVKHPTYCFFKEGKTERWSSAVDRAGNVVVKGRAYRADSRYKAAFTDRERSGTAATLWLAVVQNDTGYAAPDDWWDVTETIPDSGGVERVTVKCGKTVLAELPVKRGG